MTVPPDTTEQGTGVPPVPVPPDTTGIPPDTTGIPPGTTGIPPDPTGTAGRDGPPAGTGGTGAGGAGDAEGDAGGGAGPEDPARRRRFRPLHRLHRLTAFLVRSRRGVLVLFMLVGGAGAMLMLGGMVAAEYSESPEFCGRCHTMAPQLKAYHASSHREVSCSECHIEPGLAGMVKAKVRGTRQLVQVLTGTFPKPIPPPDHAEMPSVQDSCMRCHSIEGITSNEGPVGLVLRPTYQSDEKNTRELIAVVLRPVGLGGDSGVKGVHWHVQQNVTYVANDPAARAIGLVEITRPDGMTIQYIGAKNVTISSDVKPDIARLRANEKLRTMDCIDCHNRVGHSVPSVDQALDNALASGRISPDLPYIKKAGIALLNGKYSSMAAADRAFDNLQDTYRVQYPAAAYDDGKLAHAITELKRIYREVATPEMKVAATTYPDNLGHQEGAGCFRCHDGGHYKVVDGRVSTETIPSTCSTCHTFPQVGGSISVVPLAGQPPTHSDRLYVFTHKTASTSADPTGQSCGTCHDKSYCENCHTSGAAKVNHDEMLYNHAAVIRRTGGPACAYCHQEIYCASCHNTRVLQRPAGG